MTPRVKELLPIGNRPEPRTSLFCCVCHKDIAPTSAYRLIHVIDGGARMLHPGDEALYRPDGGDLGGLPIGSNCARKVGLEWTSSPPLSAEER